MDSNPRPHDQTFPIYRLTHDRQNKINKKKLRNAAAQEKKKAESMPKMADKSEIPAQDRQKSTAKKPKNDRQKFPPWSWAVSRPQKWHICTRKSA